MKVMLLTWACDKEDVSEPGVSARWVSELAKDHEISLLAVSRPERYGCVREQFPDIDVTEWRDIAVPRSLERFRAIVKPGYLPYFFRARRFLKEKLARERFDVIHHLSPFAWRYPSPAIGLGVPVVRGPVAGGLKTPPGLLHSARSPAFHPFMFLRGSDDFRLRHDPFLRASYRNADHVLLAAPYVERLLEPIGQRCPSSVEIELGQGPLPAGERHVRDNAAPLRLLFVGRVVPSKGVKYALLALAAATRRSAIQFTVIGDGDDLPACQAEAKRLGLSEQVSFLGWQSKSEVERHYRQADVFIFPSYREPTGGVLLEAMSFGLPIISCAYGGPEYMVDESCGVTIRPDSHDGFVAGLAQAIDSLAADPERRADLACGAYRRAQEFFSWDAKRKRLAMLYESLAARAKAKP